MWKPSIAAAGVIPEPTKDSRGRRRYVTTRKEGTHQLRHYFVSVMLADGVNVKELAEYMGHHDAAYTLKKYVHLLPDAHDRARSAMDARMFRSARRGLRFARSLRAPARGRQRHPFRCSPERDGIWTEHAGGP
ncbi:MULTISPECIES: tyrosine-type recombinase/integrase [Saccharothrix]|uniref:tyrosine-type recombinase/integrase n=1 Tax=Saccharothrix TaxID=2071 RepID=UPI00093AF32F|nr:tyrosine-type recombinase/integrase [Saccharothrix sp. CB00851]